ncbi:hypothetical protein JTE90_022384 [Oedothorax gibbosus]|uniref:Uncharacterized protein n=1 Tax=Oedothorax gibbosus TaxID=931172 RepID=A0AAV6UPA9_9ARAC|nr:hypothetical protein JTE90_022384 [Oedothorax gibbosus]
MKKKSSRSQKMAEIFQVDISGERGEMFEIGVIPSNRFSKKTKVFMLYEPSMDAHPEIHASGYASKKRVLLKENFIK